MRNKYTCFRSAFILLLFLLFGLVHDVMAQQSFTCNQSFSSSTTGSNTSFTFTPDAGHIIKLDFSYLSATQSQLVINGTGYQTNPGVIYATNQDGSMTGYYSWSTNYYHCSGYYDWYGYYNPIYCLYSWYADWDAAVSCVCDPNPVEPVLTPDPNQANIIPYTTVTGIASGGSIKGYGTPSYLYEYEHRYGGTGGWAPGQPSAPHPLGLLEVRTRLVRTDGSSNCYSGWAVISWNVECNESEDPVSVTATPDTYCSGGSATLTLSGGGGGTNEVIKWYTGSCGENYIGTGNDFVVNPTETTTYLGRYEGTSPCSYASACLDVTVTVEAPAVAGTLAKTPDFANVCQGTDVSALLTTGSGGNNADETQYRTFAGAWSDWDTYVSGTDISTTGKTGVEIQTRRLADYCSASEYTTVSWSVEVTPVSGTLVKTPDIMDVCEGTSLSAAFSAGSGGNGTDVLEYRTQTGAVWSDWATYVSGNAILTSGLSGVEVHTYRVADYCDDAATVTVNWIVDPTTIGGAVTGGGVVCYGENSTLLTLSGHEGIVLRWEWSTNGVDWNVIANTAETYTATDLIADTWFRAVVQSGVCLVENSDATQITVFSNYHISGYAKYNNNPKTPLNGLKITLKQSGTPVGSPYITGTTGFYEFTGLINGTYDLEIASAHASSAWQTWGGVNSTDYLLVARHAAGSSLLTTTPPVVRVAADVKSPSTPPVITTADAAAIQYAAKYGWGSPVPYFDIPKWVFSGLNASTALTGIELTCGNVTRDIRGLCAGDVNASYVPPYGIKEAAPGVELVNSGLLPVTSEIIFPVKAESDMEIGAITLMLDFDASLMEITGVEMPGQAEEAPYFFVTRHPSRVTDGVLNVGWMSLNPMRVADGESVLLIHARLINDEIRNPKSEIRIRFTLNENPISELADVEGNVIDGAKLAVADAGHASPVTRHENLVKVYPNPASDLLNIEYLMESEGMFSLELMNTHGVVIMKADKTHSPAGMNKTTINLRELPNGAYLLKAVCGESTKTVKVIVNR